MLLKPIEHTANNKVGNRHRIPRLFWAEVWDTLRMVSEHTASMDTLSRPNECLSPRLGRVVKYCCILTCRSTPYEIVDLPSVGLSSKILRSQST